MSSAEPLVGYEPAELNFPLELNTQVSSSIRLLNKTRNYVFYKLLTTSPRKYGVQPRIGVLLPGSVCDITVTTRVREAPRNMRSKDQFMIQSAVAHPGATVEDARRFLFSREVAPVFQVSKLRVAYSRPESPSQYSGMDNSRNVLEVTSPDRRPDDNVTEVTNPDTGPDDNVAEMSSLKLLDVQPPELKVPSNTEMDHSCLLKLCNVTSDHVAFRVKPVSPKYIVQPNIGSLSPHSTCDITVKVQVVPSDVQSEDRFLVQSMVCAAAATMEDIQDMFDNGRPPIRECELQVVSILEEENDNTAQADDLFLRIIVICLLVLVSCYIMRQMLTWIWTLIMLAVMLAVKMIQKLVSESVEDWVVKALFSIFKYVWTQVSPLILQKWTVRM